MTRTEHAHDYARGDRESLPEAVEEVLKLWIDSKDGIVTRRSIEAIAEKYQISPKLLSTSWQNFLTAVVASKVKRT